MPPITITFKTPDAINDALEEAFGKEEDDTDEDAEDRGKARAFLEKYIKYGEVVTIEFNPEEGTARVLKA